MQGRFGQLMLVSFSPQFSPHFWKKTFWWAWGENTQAHPFFSTPPPNQTPLKTSFSPLFSPKFSIFLKISPNKHTLSLIPSLQIPIFQHPKSPPHHIFKKGCGNEHHKVPGNNNFFLLFSDNFFFCLFCSFMSFFFFLVFISIFMSSSFIYLIYLLRRTHIRETLTSTARCLLTFPLQKYVCTQFFISLLFY